jgi:hypothetical protein
VLHLLVPPVVPADSIGACSQLEYVRCLCAVYAVSSSVSAVHRSATPTGAASSACLTLVVHIVSVRKLDAVVHCTPLVIVCALCVCDDLCTHCARVYIYH